VDDLHQRGAGAIVRDYHCLFHVKKAQSQLVQSEKLAGLGQMVAGVAHEINNPLSFVGNNVAVLERDLKAIRELLDTYRESDDVLKEHAPQIVSRIEHAVQQIDLEYTLGNLNDLLGRSREGLRRIQQIVRDLRDFARLDESERQDANINAGIESTVNIAIGLAKKKGVRVDLQLGPLPLVSCHPGKINQAIMNLLTNALDASQPQSTVIISTRHEGGKVIIEVSDTGTGIDPAIREKIFDPFFTTKMQGEGMGLGLSITHGIIQEHEGQIRVESVQGEGARFIVELPLKRRVEITASSAA
jgi:two-component system, NtrC family, sensor kinase